MIINTSLSVLNQLNSLLSELSTEEYTGKLEVLNGSSIGQHVRHITEFFQCLLGGFNTGTIDYEARKRNITIETDLMYTLGLLKNLCNDIKNVKNPCSPLLIKVSYDDADSEYIETNFMRELVYMIEHSIHHFALIRIGIQENFEHIPVESEFGVAYSTIRYKRELMISEKIQ